VPKHRLELGREPSPAARAGLLRQLAVVAEQRVGRDDVAVWALEQLATLLPADRETLDSLARLYARLERHADLVRVLGRQIELCEDPEQRVALAFKQADLLEEKLADPTGAAQVFETIIAKHAPADLDAHRRLKLIYLRLGDHRRACHIAERELFLTDDVEDKLSLALEIANLWRDKVKDDQRAAACFERVLELSKDNADALHALRRLYHSIGAYGQLMKLAPALFGVLQHNRERQLLLIEVGQVSEEHLNDPEAAFNWYRRAYDLYPDDGVALGHLHRLAQANQLWEDLLSTLGEARRRVTTAEDALGFTREMAGICEQQLHDPAGGRFRRDGGHVTGHHLCNRQISGQQMQVTMAVLYDLNVFNRDQPFPHHR
jgi:tetratricopeptide (TPR) repeat protein